MSTINLRPRRPLDPLPLSQFTGLPLPPPPSPISLPNKRSHISSPGRIGESSTSSKHRKVSGEHDGQETIRRKKSDITPRAKRALAEDELGTGKSPARRLFVDEGISLGISGAVASPSGPSRTLDFSTSSNTSSNIPGPSRGLAPSPPMSSAPSPAPQENGATFDPHDPGFDIHPDPTVLKSYLASPDSRPNRQITLLPTAPPTPTSSVSIPDYDQENIPPPRATPTPSSTRSTPSKSSKSSISGSSSSSRFYDDNDIVNLTGSGRRRVREPSKLNKVLKSSTGPEDEDEELTPGRTRVAGAKDKGKQKMTVEVNHHV